MSQAANESQQDGIYQHLFSSRWHSIHALYIHGTQKTKIQKKKDRKKLVRSESLK